jgi:hypothetical protein
MPARRSFKCLMRTTSAFYSLACLCRTGVDFFVLRGKEALVEKFKNSAIMDERESWRPKIFYSSGPQVGQPEPFPAPTHQRRKERSAHNRGALYVPGTTRLHGGGTRSEEYDRGERHVR